MKEVKILHCADFHLGAEFSSLGDKAAQRQRELLFAFERIVSVCGEEKVDFLLIAGDLFDHIHIDNQIYNELIESVSKIPDVIIAIAPGNHDPFSIDSWYYSKPWPENVLIFKDNLSCVTFKDKNVCLWGGGFTSTYHPASIFAADSENMPEMDSDMINICLMHGDLVSQGVTSNYNPMTKEQFKQYRFDYIALGHVHKRSEIQKTGKTFYSYSGCPEGHGFDETGELGVYIGMIGINRCSLEFRKTCQRSYHVHPVDVSNLQTNQEISSQIVKTLEERFADDHMNNLYKIILTGEIPESMNIDIENITQRISSFCYYAKIEDQTTIAIDYESLAREGTLKGLFVKNMLDKIDTANSKNNTHDIELAKMALQYGLKAFDGEVEIF